MQAVGCSSPLVVIPADAGINCFPILNEGFPAEFVLLMPWSQSRLVRCKDGSLLNAHTVDTGIRRYDARDCGSTKKIPSIL